MDSRSMLYLCKYVLHMRHKTGARAPTWHACNSTKGEPLRLHETMYFPTKVDKTICFPLKLLQVIRMFSESILYMYIPSSVCSECVQGAEGWRLSGSTHSLLSAFIFPWKPTLSIFLLPVLDILAYFLGSFLRTDKHITYEQFSKDQVIMLMRAHNTIQRGSHPYCYHHVVRLGSKTVCSASIW